MVMKKGSFAIQISGNEIKTKSIAEWVIAIRFYQQEINAAANSMKGRQMTKNRVFLPVDNLLLC
jgi:hypothetical protein